MLWLFRTKEEEETYPGCNSYHNTGLLALPVMCLIFGLINWLK